MSTTYTWRIVNLERETLDGFVFTAHYTVDATDGTYQAGAYGSLGLDRPENLIPFADLTEEMVISWVQEKLGGDAVVNIETALQGQLDEQRRPSKASGVPWTTSAGVTGGATEPAPAAGIAPEGEVVTEPAVVVNDTNGGGV